VRKYYDAACKQYLMFDGEELGVYVLFNKSHRLAALH
jgi:hypothetical protein